MYRRIVRQTFADVSVERIASIFRVEAKSISRLRCRLEEEPEGIQ
jgi:hypothetical protein